MSEVHDDEGLDFEQIFKQQLGRDLKGGTQERLRAERKAGRTPKQRAKRAKKPYALSYRYGDDTAVLLAALMAKLKSDKTTVLDSAIAALAAQERVKIGD